MLPKEGAVVIVSSTYNGTPPDNASAFAKWLDAQKEGEWMQPPSTLLELIVAEAGVCPLGVMCAPRRGRGRRGCNTGLHVQQVMM